MDMRERIQKIINSYSRIIPISLMIVTVFLISDIGCSIVGVETLLFSFNHAFAQQQSTEEAPLKGEAKTPSAHDSVLMNSLLERQKQLDNREKILKEEEKKIEVLKKEVMEKIEALKAMEEKMSPSLDVQKAEKDKKYQALAKMYEATPSEKAATIFERMDRKMAAEIMLRMNSKKAGAVWAHINRDIGVEIVREITASPSIDAASAKKIAKEITGEEVVKSETTKTGTVEIAPKAEPPTAAPKKKNAQPDTLKPPDTVKSVKAETAPKAEPKITSLKKKKMNKVQSEAFKPYAIQIKAVRDLQVAKEYTKMLKEEGNDAYWAGMSAKDGGTLYRIFVGHFASREEALRYMKNKDIVSNYPGSYVQKNGWALPEKKKKRK